jgi:RNA polymerase sigma-70 factor (ECF subfamily)
MTKNKSCIERLKNKERNIQIELINRFNSRIFSYFRCRVKGENSHEDLVQEVFTAFFNGIENNKIIDDKYIAPYIFGISKRVLYNYFYKKKKNINIQKNFSQTIELSYNLKENEKIESENMIQIINKFVNKLSELDKIILKEFYLKENKIDEIAELLDKSKHYISVRKARALKKIKNEIFKQKDIYNIWRRKNGV